MKKYLFLLLIVPLCSFAPKKDAVKQGKLKPYCHHTINLLEPSDICLVDAKSNNYYIVSNRGSIAEIDSTGKVLRRTKYDGSDYEALCMKDNMLYAIDESVRRVDIIDPASFKIKKSLYMTLGGARNKSYEGLTYVPSEHKFIAVAEKPAIICEWSENFQVLGQVHLKQFDELSAITYHDGYLWLLSDENHEVMKVNTADYSIVSRWSIPVNNPEGIAFDNDGNLMVMSDDEAVLYKFKIQ